MGGFENAGNSNNVSLSSSSCQVHLSQAFDQGIYSFLKTNCQNCHSSGPGQGLFANFDEEASFQAFQTIGWERISEQAVSATHQAPFTGPHLQGDVDGLTIKWGQQKSNYETCLQSVNQNSSGRFDILSSKAPLAASVEKWEILSWDLNDNFYLNSSYGLNIKFSVDVRPYFGETNEVLTAKERAGAASEVNFRDVFAVIEYRGLQLSDAIGLVFKNPRFDFEDEVINTIFLGGIDVFVNDILLEKFAAWSELDLLLAKNIDTKGQLKPSILVEDKSRSFILVSEQALIAPNFSLGFQTLIDNTGGKNSHLIPAQPNTVVIIDEKPVIDRAITYTDLIGEGKDGVFAKNCFSCHSTEISQGGLSLENYAQAKALADKIGSRINGIGGIMPRGGSMSAENIAIVEKWIADGAPR